MITKDLRFKYGEFWRQVSNPTFEHETRTIIGFEIRKNGKFSFKIKRYSLDNCEQITYVKPYLRSGPKIGLPV